MPIGSLQSLSQLYNTSAQSANPNARLRVKKQNGRSVFYFSDKALGLRERIFGAQSTKARAALREALRDVAEGYSGADKEVQGGILSIGAEFLNVVRRSGYKHALRPDEVHRILSPIQIVVDACPLAKLQEMAASKVDHRVSPDHLWIAIKNNPKDFLDESFLGKEHIWSCRP